MAEKTFAQIAQEVAAEVAAGKIALPQGEPPDADDPRATSPASVSDPGAAPVEAPPAPEAEVVVPPPAQAEVPDPLKERLSLLMQQEHEVRAARQALADREARMEQAERQAQEAEVSRQRRDQEYETARQMARRNPVAFLRAAGVTDPADLVGAAKAIWLDTAGEQAPENLQQERLAIAHQREIADLRSVVESMRQDQLYSNYREQLAQGVQPLISQKTPYVKSLFAEDASQAKEELFREARSLANVQRRLPTYQELLDSVEKKMAEQARVWLRRAGVPQGQPAQVPQPTPSPVPQPAVTISRLGTPAAPSVRSAEELPQDDAARWKQAKKEALEYAARLPQ